MLLPIHSYYLVDASHTAECGSWLRSKDCDSVSYCVESEDTVC